MPTITDWIMVGITAVYVVATIVICWFNGKSARASRAQLEESRRQFEETKRLEIMPFLQIEIPVTQEIPQLYINLPIDDIRSKRSFIIVVLRNLGNGTATNIVYDWRCNGTVEIEAFPICAIMKGDSCCIQFFVEYEESTLNDVTGHLTFQFDDLLGKSYEQKMVVVINENKITEINVDFPKYLDTVLYSLKPQNDNGVENVAEGKHD